MFSFGADASRVSGIQGGMDYASKVFTIAMARCQWERSELPMMASMTEKLGTDQQPKIRSLLNQGLVHTRAWRRKKRKQ